MNNLSLALLLSDNGNSSAKQGSVCRTRAAVSSNAASHGDEEEEEKNKKGRLPFQATVPRMGSINDRVSNNVQKKSGRLGFIIIIVHVVLVWLARRLLAGDGGDQCETVVRISATKTCWVLGLSS